MASLTDYSEYRKSYFTKRENYIINFLRNHIKKFLDEIPIDFFQLIGDFILILLIITFILCVAVIISELTNYIIFYIRRLYNGHW